MKHKITIGQVLYRNNRTSIKEYTVTSIGKKYFYCDDDDKRPYSLITLDYKSKEYSQHNYQLYLTVKEIEDENRTRKLFSECKAAFTGYVNTFTLPQLERIHAIINNDQLNLL